jgi:ubiquinone/menaquinone biosynthesis C-methylase UbiE
VTLKYEGAAHVSDDVRYEFADLRALPYRDEWFSHAICASTLEHVGMDNTLYGAAGSRSTDPADEAVAALRELLRVTRAGGSLLLTVPFGRRSDRGWLRVFDGDDLERVIVRSGWSQQYSRFFRATLDGWREVDQEQAREAGYNEPAGRGERSSPSFVAAAEAVALVEFVKR